MYVLYMTRGRISRTSAHSMLGARRAAERRASQVAIASLTKAGVPTKMRQAWTWVEPERAAAEIERLEALNPGTKFVVVPTT